ncbi:hypothetical protein HPC49_24870, partial [Pyxidicoccus fallax]|nr:hypothetical protein [Pyxidicoccus fallax]
DPLRATLPSTLQFVAQQLDATANALPSTAYPTSTTPDGTWATREPSYWSSGSLPASFWLMYQYTGEPHWKARAERWQARIEPQKFDTEDQDVGAQMLASFGNGYRLTGDETYREIVLTAAESYSHRYNARMGLLRSRGEPDDAVDFRVIIENMRTMEILFWGARNGGRPEWYDMAYQHSLTAMHSHVQGNGRTRHVINFDPATGEVKEQGKEKSCTWETTWSRGQAWALYGFTVAYRETGDPRFLQTARDIADYFLAHLPEDQIPYWYLEAPRTPDEPRDSSAAAIAASALVELSQLEPDASQHGMRYWNAARGILSSLSSPAYLARGKSSRAILLHGTDNKPNGHYDTGLSFGDNYFIEALLRYSEARPPSETGGSLRTRSPRAPGPGARGIPLAGTMEPISGMEAMRVGFEVDGRRQDASADFLENRFPASDEFSVAFDLRMEALPSSDTRLMSFTRGDTVRVSLVLRRSGELQLSNGESDVGAISIKLRPGQSYRVALRQKKDSGPYVTLEASLAKQGEDFDCPFASSRVLQPQPTADRLRLGATDGPRSASIENLTLSPAS